MKFVAPLSILFFVLLFQESLFSAKADRQFIENTCKGIVKPFYNLCLSILLADPNSQNADLTGLALIAVNGVKNRGILNQKHIEALKKSRPELMAALVECGKVYNTMVGVDVPLSVIALRLGNAKYAENGMADFETESQACERSFQDLGQTSPMTIVNKDMENGATIARGIIRMLL